MVNTYFFVEVSDRRYLNHVLSIFNYILAMIFMLFGRMNSLAMALGSPPGESPAGPQRLLEPSPAGLQSPPGPGISGGLSPAGLPRSPGWRRSSLLESRPGRNQRYSVIL
jgi:hypothetical protein